MITITWKNSREKKSCPHIDRFAKRPVMVSIANAFQIWPKGFAEVNGQVRIMLRCL